MGINNHLQTFHFDDMKIICNATPCPTLKSQLKELWQYYGSKSRMHTHTHSQYGICWFEIKVSSCFYLKDLYACFSRLSSQSTVQTIWKIYTNAKKLDNFSAKARFGGCTSSLLTHHPVAFSADPWVMWSGENVFTCMEYVSNPLT